VQQLFLPRSTPAPVLFYPIVHLTDVTLPRDDDLPIEARVEAHVGGRRYSTGATFSG